MTWSRAQLSAQVDVLADEHEGRAFVEAVECFAAELEEDDRARLGQVLLERAEERGALDYGLVRRIDEPRWKLFRRRPREPGR